MSLFNHISKLVGKDPVIIIPFGGYANHKMLHAQARVLEDEGIQHAEEDGTLKNLWNSYKRFESDEVKGAKVIAKWANKEERLISDEEGYIYLDVAHETINNEGDITWIPIAYQLFINNNVEFSITSFIMKPGTNAEFGVISDIDDTVLKTGVSSLFKWKVLVNSFMKNVGQRIPLEGAREFYALLHEGKTSENENPFFYLSNSPWNLYEYLSDFLHQFEFPKGVLLLRDFELKKTSSFMDGNKYQKVKHILETYPSLPFILIGDAAEKDIDIYLDISKKFPGRILAIYIRSVKRKSKVKRINDLIKKHPDYNIILISNGNDAIKHARSNGWIQ